MSIKIEKAPIFYTLTQIKFNPVQQLADFIPAIQERFRKKYPDFQKEVKTEFLFNLRNENAKIEEKKNTHWSFANIDRTEGYLLFQNGIVFHTTQYISFEKFLTNILDGFSLIHEILGLSFIEQIGLRYLNAVHANDADSLEKYLNPSLLGLSTALTEKLAHSFTETVFETEDGKIISKTLITENGLAWPPDLQPNQLTLKPNLPTGKMAVLDIDYSIVKRSPIDTNQIKQQLTVAHDVITRVFQKSVSDYARKIWS